MRANRLSSSTIIAGNYLTIECNPQRKVAAAKPKATAVPVGKDVIQYKVVRGDTLSEIAQRFKVSVKSIKRLNGV
jgi:LysM repeat protein